MYVLAPPASHGFTRRSGGASITIIPAEREDCSRIYIVWVASVCRFCENKVKIK